MPDRREFLESATLGSLAIALTARSNDYASSKTPADNENVLPVTSSAPIASVDLSPAQWIWYPSERTLANTFILFRKELHLSSPVRSATGWITADSRYEFRVNGKRVQWGPAPCDPRWFDVDGVSFTKTDPETSLVLGATVLFYGHGDGTNPIGKPGFIFTLELILQDDRTVHVVSDATWDVHLARCWRPGRYKRWYLRSLQEEFDARLYPYGWDAPGFTGDRDWLKAMPLACRSDKPPICSSYADYAYDTRGDEQTSFLIPRSIPLLRETKVPAQHCAEAFTVKWNVPPETYFDLAPPGAYAGEGPANVEKDANQGWTVTLDGKTGAALTFEFGEQLVGFPYFTIEAPAGTTIEAMVQEGHALGSSLLMNTHFHAWARFICREGVNHFQFFEYESLRWLQLHIHNGHGKVHISTVGVLRRMFPWPYKPHIAVAEPPLQRLIDASLNTLYNSAQETAVDGMGRERQQYSGDGGHQLHAVHLVMGEPRIPARFLSTFSQGLTLEGYFLDCWPAYDRLSRLMQRQVGMTIWGPLLDHGVGFAFDCYHHWMYTGNLEEVREPYVRLQRFIRYLASIQAPDGLLPVTGLGTPAVWIDHDAYKPNHQHHKQCAFNLYVAAMLGHAFAPLALAFGEMAWATYAERLGKQIHEATIRTFWSTDHRAFVANLPWLAEETELRMCDRSLATSILFDLCPLGDTAAAVEALATMPAHVGLSYPANACWRHWALSKAGRTDVVLQDFRERWATMDSVHLNNTIGEGWKPLPDSTDQWSHCAVVPLYVMFMSIAGIMPLAPGFARVRIRPQPATLERLELLVPSVRGDIAFRSEGTKGNRRLTIRTPETCEGELVLSRAEKVQLKRRGAADAPGTAVYELPRGVETVLRLVET